MKTDVCIVGGGPAGMILGNLLARDGLSVIVLEKNKDFEREFRGEVLQPRFLRAMASVGMLETIQAISHSKFDDLRLFYKEKLKVSFDMRIIDPEYPYITWMTQPDLLRGLHASGSKLGDFQVFFDADMVDFKADANGAHLSYRASDGGLHEIQSQLVVGADGRFSHLRKVGNFHLASESHVMDVAWFEMHRPESYRHGADFFISPAINTLILPKYPDKIQCGILLRPDTFRKFVKQGPVSIARKLKQAHPMFETFADKLVDFKSFSLLNGKTELLSEWSRDRLLMIGDAAHTCSPAGAVGVTIAVETAIVAARVISSCFKRNDLSQQALAEVMHLRLQDIAFVHRVQTNAGRAIVSNPITARIFPELVRIGFATGIAPRFARRFLSTSPVA